MLNAAEPFPKDPAWPAVALRLTHSHGVPRDALVRIPAAGFGMGQLLEFVGADMPEARLRSANQCRLMWDTAQVHWQLFNGDETLVFAVNDVRVLHGKTLQVVPGDVLELGLFRFVIESAGAAPIALVARPILTALPEITVSPVPSADVPKKAASVDDAFDLRDLASAAASAHTGDEPDDPFGVLGIEGVDARSRPNPLAGLFGDMPSGAAETGLAPSAPIAPPAQGREHSKTPASVFDELHEEFVRVVRDPTQLAGRTDWEGFLSSDAQPAPDLDELSQQAEPYPLLLDILQKREGIDQVIEEFDPLGAQSLLDPDQAEDVLHLFAPDIAGTARTQMPSLTRQEHHALSPDSHMRIGSHVRDMDAE